jgi:hypothetical protein
MAVVDAAVGMRLATAERAPTPSIRNAPPAQKNDYDVADP